mgnify:FL=1
MSAPRFGLAHGYCVALTAALLALSSCSSSSGSGTANGSPSTPGDAQAERVDVTIHGDDSQAVVVSAEVVNTPSTRARGLMYRKHLEPGRGMLFVFPRPGEHPFWMKNTYISLDLIFFDAQRRIIGIIRNAAPLDETPLSIGSPSKYVLEVPGGFTAAHDIGDGLQATFSPEPPPARR